MNKPAANRNVTSNANARKSIASNAVVDLIISVWIKAVSKISKIFGAGRRLPQDSIALHHPAPFAKPPQLRLVDNGSPALAGDTLTENKLAIMTDQETVTKETLAKPFLQDPVDDQSTLPSVSTEPFADLMKKTIIQGETAQAAPLQDKKKAKFTFKFWLKKEKRNMKTMPDKSSRSAAASVNFSESNADNAAGELSSTKNQGLRRDQKFLLPEFARGRTPTISNLLAAVVVVAAMALSASGDAAPRKTPTHANQGGSSNAGATPAANVNSATQNVSNAPIPRFPPITYVGNVPATEKKVVEGVITELETQEKYYSKDGNIQKLPVLDVFVYNPTYENIHIQELASKYNPETGDVVKHEAANWNAYIHSSLYAGIKTLEARLGTKGRNLSLKFYDLWAQTRYGLTVSNFHQVLQTNDTIENIEAKAGGEEFMRDNAFYAVTPLLDLTAVLTPAANGVTEIQSMNDLGKIAQRLFEVEASKARQKRMIVLLPRTTEGYNDTAIMTALDKSVWEHEDGHKLQEGKAPGPIPRLVDEAGADFTYASRNNDPVIGAFFSKVGTVIAQRLAKSDDPNSLKGEQEFEEMAKAKYLRDMSNKYTIDTIKRDQEDDDPYDSGHPLRYFLWELHKNNPKYQVELERIHYEAIAELSSLPSLISPQSGAILNFRRSIAGLSNYFKVWIQSNVMKLQNPELRKIDPNKLWVQAEEAVQKKRLAAKHRPIEWDELFAALTGAKPAIQADYVLPEYFRCFYRQAQKYAPELLQQIKDQADIAMASDSKLIKNKTGAEDLVFSREGALEKNPMAIRPLTTIIENLGELRARLAANFDEEDYRDYLENLEKLQEFERTGNIDRLLTAHPITFHRQFVTAMHDRLLKNERGNLKLPRETIDVRRCWLLREL